MAHKKAGGTSRNGRDSNAQRMGMKTYGGQAIKAGAIIIRQRGSKFYPRKNVGMGSGYTLFAKSNGFVQFESGRKVSVLPSA